MTRPARTPKIKKLIIGTKPSANFEDILGIVLGGGEHGTVSAAQDGESRTDCHADHAVLTCLGPNRASYVCFFSTMTTGAFGDEQRTAYLKKSAHRWAGVGRTRGRWASYWEYSKGNSSSFRAGGQSTE